MKVNIEIKGREELAKELKRQAQKTVKNGPVAKVVYSTALDIQRQAKYNLKELKAWDTGHAARTTIVELEPDSLGAEIGTVAPYALYIEYGTKPHFPPPDALEAWARHHGFDSAWPICLAISKRGTPARPYLLPAYYAYEGEFYDRLKELMRK